MLPAATRLTRREDFATAVRRGRRAARGALVVHLALRPGAASTAPDGPLVGFIVGRAVGGAVVRHRVQRRLRHLMRSRLRLLPAGVLLVIRALPAAAGASSGALAGDLDAALGAALRRFTRAGAPNDTVTGTPTCAGAGGPR